MIKNAFIFRLTEVLSADDLNEQLAKHRFNGIGSLEKQAIGFEPLADDLDLIHEVGGVRAGCVRVDSKSIPGSTLKQMVKERCAQIEEQQGYAPGRKQRNEIKEMLIDQLLPKVLPTTKRITFFIYDDLMIIDSSSPATADVVVGLFARCVDPLPATTIRTERSPAAAMTQWLVGDEAPDGFSIDQEVEMKASNETRASVRWKNETVDLKEAQDHFRQGKQCIKMAMTWADRVSFALNDKGVITKIKPLDVLKEIGMERAEEGLDGEIALVGTEVYKLVTGMIDALGGEVEL